MRIRRLLRHPVTWAVLAAGADLTGLRTVTVWCRRFSVSSGAAAPT
ncbi:DM13 domain-containing protein [Streptomyces anulatus]